MFNIAHVNVVWFLTDAPKTALSDPRSPWRL